MNLNEILQDRESVHGNAEINFAITGRMWAAMLGIDDIPAWQVALMMDVFKTVRCISNPLHTDSWDDKHGYTKHAQAIAMGEN